MKIGMLIAIERELKAFLNQGMEIREETINHRTVYSTRMGKHEIYALCSGWGVIDAAAGTQLLITACGCECVINFGVVGALIPGLRVEDLFLVRKVCAYGFDTSPIDKVKKHQYAEFRDEYIPLDEKLFEKARAIMPELKEAVAASGDRFIEDREEKKELAALGCNICDMEIAAIARVCFLNGVPALSVKCISDTFEGNGGDFDTNVERSAKTAFRVILQLLDELV